MGVGDYSLGVQTQNSKNIEATCIVQGTQMPEIKYFVPAWDPAVMIYDGGDFVGVTSPDETENTITNRIDPTFKGDIKPGHVTRDLASGPQPTRIKIKIEKLIDEYNIGGQANKFYILDENDEIHVIIHIQPHGFASGLKWEINQYLVLQNVTPITSIDEDENPFDVKTAGEILLPQVIFGSETEKNNGKAGYTIDQIGSVDLSGKRVMFLQGVGALTGDVSKSGDNIHLEMERPDTQLDLANNSLTFSGNNITGYLSVVNADNDELVFSGSKIAMIIKSDNQDCVNLSGSDYHVVHNGKSSDSSIEATIASIQSWIDGQGVEDANAVIDNLKDMMDAFANIPEGDNIIENMQTLATDHTNDITTIENFLEFLKPHSVVEMAYPFIDGIHGDKDDFAALTWTNGIPRDSDGKIRFWTTIRGRKPIVAPVGGYAGMDRFDLDSLQLLDDEYGPNGEKVYAIDGRENVRVYGGNWKIDNSANGNYIMAGSTSATSGLVFEIIGFFDSVRIGHFYHVNESGFDSIFINGVLDSAASTYTDDTKVGVSNPLQQRYLDHGHSFELDNSNINLGLNTLSGEASLLASEYIGLYSIELGIDSDKVTIPAQKCIADGKKWDIAYNQSLPHKPDVWAANYGKVGYDGQYDQGLDTWGFGEDVKFAVSDHDADDTQYSGNPLNIFDWVLDSTEVKAYQVLNPFKVSGIHQATNGYQHVNWSTGLDYSALPASGNPVTAGTLYYYASGTKLYKCIKSGTLTYTTQQNIEDSGLFAYRRPTNGYRTCFITHALINTGLSRNFVRATRWLPPAARHIGNSAIDQRNSGQQRPVFEAGDVDFDGQELAVVYNWRQFGNGDKNGSSTTGFDTLSNGASNRAFVLDDAGAAMVGASIYSNADGVLSFYSQGSDSHIIATLPCCTGFRIIGITTASASGIYTKVNNVKIEDGARTGDPSQACSLPFGTHTYQIFLPASTNTAGVLFSEIHIYQPKLPDLPEGAHLINEYMGMADAVSPTEYGNLVIGKGVRRVHATRDVFYDDTVSDAGAPELSSIGTIYPGGFAIHMGDTSTSAGVCSAQLPFYGKGITYVSYFSATYCFIDIYIDELLLTVSNFPNARINFSNNLSFDDSTGRISCITTDTIGQFSIHGLDDENHVLKTEYLTSSINNHGYACAFDLYPGIHRSNHYSKLTYNPYVSPELVGGGDGICNDNLIVSPDGKMLEEVRRPDKSKESAILLKTANDSGNGALSTRPYNVRRGFQEGNNFYSRGWVVAGTSGPKLLCLKPGPCKVRLEVIIANGTQSTVYIYKNGVQSKAVYMGDPTVNQGSPIIYEDDFKKGDYIDVQGSSTIYGDTAIRGGITVEFNEV